MSRPWKGLGIYEFMSYFNLDWRLLAVGRYFFSSLVIRYYFQGYVGNDVIIHTSRAQIDKNDCDKSFMSWAPFMI